MPTSHQIPTLISEKPNIHIKKNEPIKILEENKTEYLHTRDG